MFKKLRNKIIIITMVTTTAVLVLAGSAIMIFSSNLRPEPKIHPEPISIEFNRELEVYIKTDRKEGDNRLLITLVSVGAIIEVAVFLITYVLSKKIVEPVKDSYEKQKIFIANASHELKTPLAVIQANVEALEVNKDNEKWKDNIENEVVHANKLVLDLLQLAKIDAGSIGKSPVTEFDLKSELAKHIEMFEPKFAGKISFDSKAADSKYILASQDVLQVFDILLDNAIKYGDKKILVTLDNKSVAVSNDGAKISKKDIAKIFDRFYQTDKTKEGSGLGLAILKAVCDRNGWKVVCESNKMTKFKVEF